MTYDRHRKIHIHKRHYTVREKVRSKRGQTAKKTGFAFFLLAFFAVVFVFIGKKTYSFIRTSELFIIRDVKVNGLKTINEQKFINSIPEKYVDNFAYSVFFDFEKYLGSRFRNIKSVGVERRIDSHTLVLTVVERVPVAYMVEKNKSYAVDGDNCRFELVNSTCSLPEIIVSNAGFDRNEGSRILVDFVSCMREKNPEIYRQVKRAYLDTGEYVCVMLNSGVRIMWGKFSFHDFEVKTKYLEKVIKEVQARYTAKGKNTSVLGNLDYIDLKLSDENRIFVKFRKA